LHASGADFIVPAENAFNIMQLNIYTVSLLDIYSEAFYVLVDMMLKVIIKEYN